MTRTLMRHQGAGWFLALEWKPQDFWVGAFWRFDEQWRYGDLWVCLLPCLPIHFSWVAP